MTRAPSKQCGYQDCRKTLPGPYGTPGVSLSRLDNKTLICSDCGRREAFGDRAHALLRPIQ